MRNRQFETARRKLHYRLKVMEFEHQAHKRANHRGNSVACWPDTCEDAKLFHEREGLLREIICEFGGRA